MTLTSAHISFWVVFSKTGQTDSLAWTHPWVTMSNISPAHARLTSQNHCVLGLRFTGFAVYNLHMHVACALFTFHFVILYSQLLKKCRIYREKLTDKTHFYFFLYIHFSIINTERCGVFQYSWPSTSLDKIVSYISIKSCKTLRWPFSLPSINDVSLAKSYKLRICCRSCLCCYNIRIQWLWPR
jgi:hypothetical protein